MCSTGNQYLFPAQYRSGSLPDVPDGCHGIDLQDRLVVPELEIGDGHLWAVDPAVSSTCWGKEVANRRVGLLAMFFAGIAYWPNVISRVALRFTLYPTFTAPVLYFLVRGLQRRSRNDFILAGIFLGIGSARLQPLSFRADCRPGGGRAVLVHRLSWQARLAAIWNSLMLAVALSDRFPALAALLGSPTRRCLATA